MRIGKPLITACLAAVAAILLFTWLPHTGWQNKADTGDVAVFRATSEVKLSDNNLVDVLVAAQLHEKIYNAQWSNGTLSIDMQVSTTDGKPVIWFADVVRLVRVSFSQLENVKRILIRMVELNSEGSSLLSAVDVRKTDEWLINELDILSGADPIHDELWRNRLRVMFTAAWEQRYGPVPAFTVKNPTN